MLRNANVEEQSSAEFVPRLNVRASRNNFRNRVTRPNTTLVSIRIPHHILEDEYPVVISDNSDMASTLGET